jgi:Family of unknown function (DUF6528)
MLQRLSLALAFTIAIPHGMQAQRIEDPIALTDQTKVDPKILVMDPAQKNWSTANPKAVVWSWRPAESGIDPMGFGLPTEIKLRTVPAWGEGLWMAISDSYGFMGVVSYPGKVKKWSVNAGKLSNVHGIEILPSGNVAVAASTGGWVRVYTASQGATSSTYTQFDMPDAHNVLWDPQRQVLWAVGGKQLVQLKVEGTDEAPILRLIATTPLPTNGGHDLSPFYGDLDLLYVTTAKQVYLFHKSGNTFTLLQDTPNIKSINRQPATGQVIETSPHASCREDSWCTNIFDLLSPAGIRSRPNAAVYRARLFRADYQ